MDFEFGRGEDCPGLEFLILLLDCKQRCDGIG
jgi:hypothetical protein